MALECMGQLFSDWVNNSLGTVSFIILDTNGVAHQATGYPIVSNTVSVTILVFDGSDSSYTASELQITYSECSTPIISFPVSGQKTPYIALAFAVDIVINEQLGLDPIIASLMNLLGGVSPPLSFTAEGQAQEVTYSSSGTTCSSTVSSSSAVSVDASVSGSGSTITLSVTFSYGSCQQIQGPTIYMYLGSSSSPVVTGRITEFPSASAECGYDASCSFTITANVSVS